MSAQQPSGPQLPDSERDEWHVGGRTLRSRLLIGSGRFKSFDELDAVIAAAQAEVVTVSLRRVDSKGGGAALLEVLRRRGCHLLPNTSGCYSADDAVRIAELAREAGYGDWVKLEVIGDPGSLYPDGEETLLAARQLVASGFAVLPYCGDDPVLARKLEDVGCAAVMPLAAPIGSGLGLCNPHRIAMIVAAVRVPVLVDAGIGTASDATRAMELGVTAVLLNTAIAEAGSPQHMAAALRHAVQAGRLAYRAGRMATRDGAQPSSPTSGAIGGLAGP